MQVTTSYFDENVEKVRVKSVTVRILLANRSRDNLGSRISVQLNYNGLRKAKVSLNLSAIPYPFNLARKSKSTLMDEPYNYLKRKIDGNLFFQYKPSKTKLL